MVSNHTDDLPRAIGKYEVLARIGQGGMAELFLGRMSGEGGFTKLVALKRILPHRAALPEFVEMFMDEARISADLHHANIAQIFEFGRVDDTYFIAMEYVEGVSLLRLQRHFEREELLPPLPMAAYIVSCVCAALEYAHTRSGANGEPLNIIHRDVSPANILCGLEGDVKLIDFGIAKAAQRIHETAGVGLKGKISYMSPEQAVGGTIDRRADVFSAGVVLYELLTGSNPFSREGFGVLDTLARIRQCKVAPPSSLIGELPAELERICLRALGRLPEQRFPSAGEMQGELEAFCFETHYGRRQFGQWMKENFQSQAAFGPATGPRQEGAGLPPAAGDPTQPLQPEKQALPDQERTLVAGGRAVALDQAMTAEKTLLLGSQGRTGPRTRPGRLVDSLASFPGTFPGTEVQTTNSLATGERSELSELAHLSSRRWWVLGGLAVVVFAGSALLALHYARVPEPEGGAARALVHGHPDAGARAAAALDGVASPDRLLSSDQGPSLDVTSDLSPRQGQTTSLRKPHPVSRVVRKKPKPAPIKQQPQQKQPKQPKKKKGDPEDPEW